MIIDNMENYTSHAIALQSTNRRAITIYNKLILHRAEIGIPFATSVEYENKKYF